jgi:hypothetical protein
MKGTAERLGRTRGVFITFSLPQVSTRNSLESSFEGLNVIELKISMLCRL